MTVINIDTIHSLSLNSIEHLDLPSLSITETGAVLQRVNQLLAQHHHNIISNSNHRPSLFHQINGHTNSHHSPTSIGIATHLLNNSQDPSLNFADNIAYAPQGSGDPEIDHCASIMASIYQSNRSAAYPCHSFSNSELTCTQSQPIHENGTNNQPQQVFIDSILSSIPPISHLLRSKLALFTARTKLETVSDRIALTDVYIQAQNKWTARVAKLDADKIRKFTNSASSTDSYHSSFSHVQSFNSSSHTSHHHTESFSASISRPRGGAGHITASRGMAHLFSPNGGAGTSSSHLLGLDIIPSASPSATRRGNIMNGSNTGSLSSINPRSSLTTKDRSGPTSSGFVGDRLLYARSEEDVARMIQVIEDSREDRIHKLSAPIPNLVLDMPTYRLRMSRLAANGYPSSEINHVIRTEYGPALDSIPNISGAMKITNPLQYYSNIHVARGWLPCEEARFFRAYLEHAKDFGKIASDVGTRSIGQCIQWYYANKHRLQLKKELKRFRRLCTSAGGSAAAFNIAANIASPTFTLAQGSDDQSPGLSPAKPASSRWSHSETESIKHAVKQFGKEDIYKLAQRVHSKTADQCKNWLHNHKDIVMRILRDEERKLARLSRGQSHGLDADDDDNESPLDPDVTREPTPVDSVHSELAELEHSPLVGVDTKPAKKKKKRKRDAHSSDPRTGKDNSGRESIGFSNVSASSLSLSVGPTTIGNIVTSLPENKGDKQPISTQAHASVTNTQSSTTSGPMQPFPATRMTSYWRPSDKARFAELHAQYGTDWEKIAEALGSKSATQVARWYQRQQRQARNAFVPPLITTTVLPTSANQMSTEEDGNDATSDCESGHIVSSVTLTSPVKPGSLSIGAEHGSLTKQSSQFHRAGGMLRSPSPMHSRRRTASQPLPRTAYSILTHNHLPASIESGYAGMPPALGSSSIFPTGMHPYSFPIPMRHNHPIPASYAAPATTYQPQPNAGSSGTATVCAPPAPIMPSTVPALPPVLPPLPPNYQFTHPPPFPYYYGHPNVGMTGPPSSVFCPPPPLYPSVQRSVMYPPYHHHMAAAVHNHLPAIASKSFSVVERDKSPQDSFPNNKCFHLPGTSELTLPPPAQILLSSSPPRARPCAITPSGIPVLISAPVVTDSSTTTNHGEVGLSVNEEEGVDGCHSHMDANEHPRLYRLFHLH